MIQIRRWRELGVLLCVIASFQSAFASERIRNRRPSALARNLKFGPLLPLKWTMVGAGYVLNKGLLVMEDRRVMTMNPGPDTGEKKLATFVWGGFNEGSGVGGGVLLHKSFAPNLGLEVEARATHKLYQHYGLRLEKTAGNFTTGPELVYRYLPQEDFYGHGESITDGRSTYRLTEGFGGWQSRLDLGFVDLRHNIAFRHVEIGEGTDENFATTQERFGESAVDGGFDDDEWLTNEVSVMVDGRDSARNPKAGAAFETTFAVSNALSEGDDTFSTLRATGLFYIPLSDRRAHVLAIRTDVVRTLSGDVVPFYAQPTLGGSNTLRGFREQRFRDRDSLSATAEYRYSVWKFLDVALFADAGQVYSDLFDDIGNREFETAYGAGLRLNGPGNITIRVSAGHSDEGNRLFLKFGPTW